MPSWAQYVRDSHTKSFASQHSDGMTHQEALCGHEVRIPVYKSRSFTLGSFVSFLTSPPLLSLLLPSYHLLFPSPRSGSPSP